MIAAAAAWNGRVHQPNGGVPSELEARDAGRTIPRTRRPGLPDSCLQRPVCCTLLVDTTCDLPIALHRRRRTIR
jgi:hypothetical protein